MKEIHQILNVATWKKKALYLSLISTGGHPIEIVGLMKKDVAWNPEPNYYAALIPARLTKKKIARTVKFSSKVTSYVRKILKRLDNDDIYTSIQVMS